MLSSPDTLKGIGESPLEVIPWAELAGVGSMLPSENHSFTIQDLFQHKDIIECVHAFLPVIPMRFPSTLKGREKVIELLQQHSLQLEEILDRLEDKVEISLRVILDGESNSGGHLPKTEGAPAAWPGERLTHLRREKGIEYLRQKRQLQDKERQLSLRAQEIHKILEQQFIHLINESQFEFNRSMLSINYLVRRNRLEEFERIFEDIKGVFPEKTLFSGPWPPYSFVPEFLEI